MVTTFGSNITKAFTFGQEVNAIYSYGVKVFPAEPQKQWVPKEWKTASGNEMKFFGHHVWKDNNGHIYECDTWGMYELVDGVWRLDTTSPRPTFGSEVWKDNNGHIYYSEEDSQMELVNGTWVRKTWNHKPTYGSCVWMNESGYIYHNYSDESYIGTQWADLFYDNSYELVHEGTTWVYNPVNINGVPYKDLHIEFNATCIWKDNDGHIYYSDGNNQFEKTIVGWATKTWNWAPTFGSDVWKDNNGHIYCSDIDSNVQMELVNGNWVPKEWGDIAPRYGSYIWTDNDGHIYYSEDNIHYELVEINN